MTAEEAAWVGAAIEFEGTFYHHHTSTKGGGELSFVNTDVELVATVLRLVGDGRVIMLAPRGLSRKIAWQWRLSHLAGLRALAPQIAPYMTEKGARLQQRLAVMT